MKALLTSGGISNPSIEAEMWRLLGGKRKGVKLLYCLTAKNYRSEVGGMDSVIARINQFYDWSFEIDLCDITGLPKEQWLPRFEWSDVMFFNGGNTGWLRRQIKDCGLEEELPRLLENRVWVGASAGSIVLCPTICNSVQDLFDEDDFTPAGTVDGLHYVDFDFIPHLNSEWFPKVRADKIEVAARNLLKTDSQKLYALDDNGAVSIDGNKLEIISEGQVVEIDLADRGDL